MYAHVPITVHPGQIGLSLRCDGRKLEQPPVLDTDAASHLCDNVRDWYGAGPHLVH